MPDEEPAAGRGPVDPRIVQRADPDAVATLAACGVAAAHEAMDRGGLLEPLIRPIQQGVRLAGPAVTVLCLPDDNLTIHLAVEQCKPGDILVVAVTHPSSAGMIGELLATSLRAHGIVAAVIDAGVRDTAELREMGFPVWSRWISARGTVKRTAGTINRSVLCAGQVVDPGDVIIADDDGVVRVGAAAAVQVAARASERLAREDALRLRLAAGELSADLLGLRDSVSPIGLDPVDS